MPNRQPSRPNLEALEDRCTPAVFSFIGYEHGSTVWESGTNWSGGDGTNWPSTAADTATFATTSQTIDCPYNTLGNITVAPACGVNLVLPPGGLTLTQGLTMHGNGAILTEGSSLILQGSSTWDSGTIGAADVFGNGLGGSLVINNKGTLTVTNTPGMSVACDAPMFVGVTSDGATASGGTVSLQNVTLNTSADFKLQVGNANSTFKQAVFNMQDAGGVGASQINVSVPAGGTNTAFLDVYGNFNCNSAATRGLVFQNVNAPMKVETTGTLDVKYLNSLKLTANGQSNFALQCQGTTNVGLANPGGTNIGSAGVTCQVKGANFDTAGSRLFFFGLNNGWSDTGGVGTLELAVAGTLALWSPGTTYQQTTVELVDGDLRFSDNSLFKVQGQFSVTGTATLFDFLTLSGTKNNVWIGNSVSISPNAFGTPNRTTWGSVINVNGGGQINGQFAKIDGANWTDSYPGTPPNQLQLQFVP